MIKGYKVKDSIGIGYVSDRVRPSVRVRLWLFKIDFKH